MKFTDLFIRRPVLASVVSLLILVLGLRSLINLPVNQYPKTENGVVTVSTAYYGADAQTVAGFITQPLEAAVAQAQGIEYLSSSSAAGLSSITAKLQLNYDSNRALGEINTLVNSVKNQLPPQSQQPVVSVGVDESSNLMYLGFYSSEVPTNAVTDYVLRVVIPKLNAVQGVQKVAPFGGRVFAMRAWLDAKRMAGFGVTASDVSQALTANNYLTAIGSSKGQAITVDLTADTSLHSVDEFRNLIVRQSGTTLVRLKDVATVTLGSEGYDQNVMIGSSTAKWMFVTLNAAPDANVLDVAARVKAAFPAIQAQLPAGISAVIEFDATGFVRTSIREVIKTLIEALLIVTAVIFLFLGNPRAILIPVVAIPLSLVGAFGIMLALGYSINLLTLLALVLAIGLVVDDAIIVVENVDRHIHEEGLTPLQAAFRAARELANPIIAMVIVLVAVYVPIGFQGGLTGALFSEFAFTVAGAVAISGVVALTLSPMMCANLIPENQHESRFTLTVNRFTTALRARYARLLHSVLATWKVPVVLGLILLAGVVYLFQTSSSELAPEEDQGFIAMQAQAGPNTTSEQMLDYSHQILQLGAPIPEVTQEFQLAGFGDVNSTFGFMMLKPWNERSRSAAQVLQDYTGKLASVSGVQVAAFQFPALPGAGGLPVEFVINTTGSFESLQTVANAVIAKAKTSGMFFYVNSDLKIDKLQGALVVDRDKLATLGLTEGDVGSALGSALGGGFVNYFSLSGRSYKVIPQVLQTDRLNPTDVLNYYVRTASGTLVPASTFSRIEQRVVPESINRFQQLNAVTIEGVIAPSVSLSQALEFLRNATQQAAPSGFGVDYAGQSRQFQKESSGVTATLLFAMLIVFLALAAQYESFRDSIVILVSVPMALFGALIFINLGLGTLNIYTEVGLVTLMGLISKHGILIVQFANEAQRTGRDKRTAIEEAAATRLRPILMTTAAMALGVLPLVIAQGAGAAGRHAMGLVIFTGLSIGTLFTLFIVPAFYLWIGSVHRPEAVDPSLHPAA
jgi:multidrug efflux pump